MAIGYLELLVLSAALNVAVLAIDLGELEVNTGDYVFLSGMLKGCENTRRYVGVGIVQGIYNFKRIHFLYGPTIDLYGKS